jgi:hypothetical protein
MVSRSRTDTVQHLDLYLSALGGSPAATATAVCTYCATVLLARTLLYFSYFARKGAYLAARKVVVEWLQPAVLARC